MTLRTCGDEVERALPRGVGRGLELLLLAVEEAVRRAVELDELVVLAVLVQHPLELDVVLMRDALVGAALQREDRRGELRDEVDHPARPSVETDGAGEAMPRRRSGPGAAAAETEADGEDRGSAHRAE